MFKIYETSTIILQEATPHESGYAIIIKIFGWNLVLAALPPGEKRLDIWGKQRLRNVIHGEEDERV